MLSSIFLEKALHTRVDGAKVVMVLPISVLSGFQNQIKMAGIFPIPSCKPTVDSPSSHAKFE